jgi:hypothetical protein
MVEARRKLNSGGSPDSITSVSPPHQLMNNSTAGFSGTSQQQQQQTAGTTRRMRNATSSNSMNTAASSGGLGSILGFGSNGTLPTMEFWEELDEGEGVFFC